MTPEAVEECLEMMQAKAEMKHHKFEASKGLYASAFRIWPSDDIGLKIVALAVFVGEEYPDVSTLQRLYREEFASSTQVPDFPRGRGNFGSVLKITGPEMWEGVRKGILEYYQTNGTKPCYEMKEFVRRKDAQWRQG